MTPINPQDGQYFHIEFVREPKWQPQRRTRRNTGGLRPPTPQSRSLHALGVFNDITQAIEDISEIRQEKGIDPSQLFVLEFSSINNDLRKIFEERFQVWVVDERKEKLDEQDNYRFLVQFPHEEARQLFLNELALYQKEDAEVGVLHPGMRRDFFDALQEVRALSSQERRGSRIQEHGFPLKEFFYLDVDLWHPGDEVLIREILDKIRFVCRNYNGELTEYLHTSSLLLTKIYGTQQLADALLELDIVARVDLPPKLSPAYTEIFNNIVPPDLDALPSEDTPAVCVVDSGVLSGHPFLRNWVIEERDFDTGENTPTDQNGHGTSVAGLVAYGSIADCLENNTWEPKVQIYSAKVLRHDPYWGAIIPEEHRSEKITEDAIRYFAKERNCKIFNLSLENQGEVYRNGRQFPWAEKLDELARELDIVIVLITGNRSASLPENVYTREQFQKGILKKLLEDPDQRICNPGTAALALTVGALARSDALGHHEQQGGLRLKGAFPGSPSHSPAPFTRTGTGYSSGSINSAIKPELVDYGGNAAIQVIAGTQPRWFNNHILLGEPTLCLEKNGRFIGSSCGTSFASPHVAHAAAIAATSLEKAIKQKPSANLIRALVGSATVFPPCPEGWLGDEEETLRLIGYGMCSVDDLTWSKRNRVRLVAMDEIEMDKLHIYRVAVPEIFLSTPGRRGITVSLAYDPPVRASRKEYLANTMWIEAFQGLTSDQVERYRSRRTAEEPGDIPSWAEIGMRPSKTRLEWSTLQVRRKEWKRKPSLRTPADEREPIIHIVVGCKKRFPTGLDIQQQYGLVVLFWHEAEQIELYQSLQNRVTLKATRVRVYT
jgi:hypothetical protein